MSSYLQATIRVDLDPGTHCPVIDEHQRPGPVRQSVIQRDRAACCRVEVTDRDGDQVLMRDSITATCVCPVFHTHDCIAALEGSTGGELLFSLSVPDRDELRAILSSLRDAGAEPRLTQITTASASEELPTVPLEVDTLTEKQREAVRIAVDSGYYDTPRRASLEDLAARLGISRSAVSQRLAAVETKLIISLHESVGSGRSIGRPERASGD